MMAIDPNTGQTIGSISAKGPSGYSDDGTIPIFKSPPILEYFQVPYIANRWIGNPKPLTITQAQILDQNVIDQGDVVGVLNDPFAGLGLGITKYNITGNDTIGVNGQNLILLKDPIDLSIGDVYKLTVTAISGDNSFVRRETINYSVPAPDLTNRVFLTDGDGNTILTDGDDVTALTEPL